MGNDLNGQVGGAQEDAGLADAAVEQVVLNGDAHHGLELAVEIGAVEAEAVGDVLHGDRVAVRALDDAQGLLDVGGVGLRLGKIGIREFVGEEEEILVEDAVH